jgi:segregation and condensation protein A
MQPMTQESELNASQAIVAIVKGQELTAFPRDLYIPPDALEVFLEAFEGPLDLLLYLIKKQNLDILDIPIAKITQQYVQYVELMQNMRLELAAEYLVMAAMLAEIKSRMLLPRPTEKSDEEQDPRAELIRRLQEYERIKQAAIDLDAMPQVNRDIFPVIVEPPLLQQIKPLPQVDLRELLLALQHVLSREEVNAHHHVQREVLSIRERMSRILNQIQNANFVTFEALFDRAEGRMGVVVTFIALLELIRQRMIELVQPEPFAPIHIKKVHIKKV